MADKRLPIMNAAILMAAFIAFTLLVAMVDKAPIGPDGVSMVGLSHINQAVQRAIGKSEAAYSISKYLGLLAMATVPLYGLAGIWQLFCRRSLKKVDRSLIVLGIYYLIIALIYVLFEKLAINLRPVFESDGSLEPSYPSTHTILGIALLGASLIISRQWLRNAGHATAASCAALLHILAMAGIVVGRLLAGVHWFTDIIGGILLSTSLLCGYAAAIRGARTPRHTTCGGDAI